MTENRLNNGEHYQSSPTKNCENHPDLESIKRTEMCFFFLKGNCLRDNECKFSHEEPPCFNGTVKRLCRYFAEGRCRYGKICRYSHTLPENYNGRNPASSNPTGLVSFNQDCYSLSDASLVISAPDCVPTVKAVTQICRFYKRGTCYFGERCINSHDNPSNYSDDFLSDLRDLEAVNESKQNSNNISVFMDDTNDIFYDANDVCYDTSDVCYDTSDVCYDTSDVCYDTSDVCYDTSDVCYDSDDACYEANHQESPQTLNLSLLKEKSVVSNHQKSFQTINSTRPKEQPAVSNHQKNFQTVNLSRPKEQPIVANDLVKPKEQSRVKVYSSKSRPSYNLAGGDFKTKKWSDAPDHSPKLVRQSAVNKWGLQKKELFASEYQTEIKEQPGIVNTSKQPIESEISSSKQQESLIIHNSKFTKPNKLRGKFKRKQYFSSY